MSISETLTYYVQSIKAEMSFFMLELRFEYVILFDTYGSDAVDCFYDIINKSFALSVADDDSYDIFTFPFMMYYLLLKNFIKNFLLLLFFRVIYIICNS